MSVKNCIYCTGNICHRILYKCSQSNSYSSNTVQ